MKQFKLIFSDGCPDPDSPYELRHAVAFGNLLGLEEALAELEIGQTYVDADGDTWERIA